MTTNYSTLSNYDKKMQKKKGRN